MNATDTFIEEYTAAVTSKLEVMPIALADACCDLVKQVKGDGFRSDQVVAFVKEQMAEAGGQTFETQRLDNHLTQHCIEEYFRPVKPRPMAA